MPGPGPPQNRERGGCSASEPLSRDRRDIGSGSGRGTAAASRFKHGDVIVCATTACLRARLRTAPIRSRERQRADAQLLMTFCLDRSVNSVLIGNRPSPATVTLKRLHRPWEKGSSIAGRSRLLPPPAKSRHTGRRTEKPKGTGLRGRRHGEGGRVAVKRVGFGAGWLWF